jgi:hypothetical protein
VPHEQPAHRAVNAEPRVPQAVTRRGASSLDHLILRFALFQHSTDTIDVRQLTKRTDAALPERPNFCEPHDAGAIDNKKSTILVGDHALKLAR